MLMIWMERLIAWACLLQSLEMLAMHFPKGRAFKGMLIGRVLFAAAALLCPHGILALGLLLSTWAIAIRFGGSFNGGSDAMTFQILSAWVFAWITGREDIALMYVAIVVLLSYFMAGFSKIQVRDWRQGRALSEILLQSNAARPVRWIQKMARQPKRIRLTAWAVIFFELMFPALVLTGSKGVVLAVALGLVFHLANFFVFGLNRFVWAWIAAYPALFALSCTLLHSVSA